MKRTKLERFARIATHRKAWNERIAELAKELAAEQQWVENVSELKRSLLARTDGNMSNEPSDKRGPVVIVMGSVLTGFEFYGPCESIDSAMDELEKLALVPSCTVVLMRPVSELPFRDRTKES